MCYCNCRHENSNGDCKLKPSCSLPCDISETEENTIKMEAAEEAADETVIIDVEAEFGGIQDRSNN